MRYSRSLTFCLVLLGLLAILSSCSGLYRINSAIAYDLKYNRSQDTHTDLNLEVSNHIDSLNLK